MHVSSSLRGPHLPPVFPVASSTTYSGHSKMKSGGGVGVSIPKHAPWKHDVSGGQKAPHPPQLLLSLPWVLMQMPPQSSSGKMHSSGGAWQKPPAQECPSGQKVPQAPQFPGSVCRSVQNVTQLSGAFSGQVQPPPAQEPPLGQTLLQTPQ
jgi:hypothetical protein